jgi:uncharacterized repeat protein (TIGR04042 family)
MPETWFVIRWPDGTTQNCYSPSLAVKNYLSSGQSYQLTDFLARCRTALTVASERVKAKYGYRCWRALARLVRIETTATSFSDAPDARVSVEAFAERVDGQCDDQN